MGNRNKTVAACVPSLELCRYDGLLGGVQQPVHSSVLLGGCGGAREEAEGGAGSQQEGDLEQHGPSSEHQPKTAIAGGGRGALGGQRRDAGTQCGPLLHEPGGCLGLHLGRGEDGEDTWQFAQAQQVNKGSGWTSAVREEGKLIFLSYRCIIIGTQSSLFILSL